MNLPPSLTSVTWFSKSVAAIIFFLFILASFSAGLRLGKRNTNDIPKTAHINANSTYQEESFSSTSIEGPDKSTVRVYLYASDETQDIEKNLSCPSPAIGAKTYSGHYQLILDPSTVLPYGLNEGLPPFKWTDAKIDIGSLWLVEDMPWDGHLQTIQVDPKGRKNAVFLFQSTGCNTMAILLYGYDFNKKQFIQYKFKHLDGSIEDTASTGPGFSFNLAPYAVNNIIETGYYDNGIGKVIHTQWKFNADDNSFHEVRSWHTSN